MSLHPWYLCGISPCGDDCPRRPKNPQLDAVIADTIAKMRAPFANIPPRSIPAKRRQP